MSDIPARRDPGPHAELTTNPNPHSGATPESVQPDPTLQPDHPVSNFTMAVAGLIGLFILGTVIYGLNNSETPTAVASASDTAGAAQPAPDQAKSDPAKTSAAAGQPADPKAAAKGNGAPANAAAPPAAPDQKSSDSGNAGKAAPAQPPKS